MNEICKNKKKFLEKQRPSYDLIDIPGISILLHKSLQFFFILYNKKTSNLYTVDPLNTQIKTNK